MIGIFMRQAWALATLRERSGDTKINYFLRAIKKNGNSREFFSFPDLWGGKVKFLQRADVELFDVLSFFGEIMLSH